jgi:RNA polymerase sigma-70 factor (ECF subfamily)
VVSVSLGFVPRFGLTRVVLLSSVCGYTSSVPTDIEGLYREHRAGLIRLVERELHDHHDAEDVVQTAFLDAQRAVERGTIPRNPRAWLAAIALNAGRRLRRRRLNAEPLEEYAVQEAWGMSEIRAALATLPREQRAAVLYRDVLGLSYGETAEQMGRSVNAVTMLLHRGRQRLRQTLAAIAGGVGLWRCLKQAGAPRLAIAKGAAAVVVAGGIATGGTVAAWVVARSGTDMTAELATRSGSLVSEAGRTRGGALLVVDSARHLKSALGSRASVALAPTQGSSDDAVPKSVRASTTDAVAPSLSLSRLQVPTVPLPKVRIATLPATVAATVSVITPITATTATAPLGTTAEITTPITTVSVPVP